MKHKILILFGLVFLLCPTEARAYTDRIDAPAQEVFDAAKGCFDKEGISDAHVEKGTITTKWIYATIEEIHRHPFSLKTKQHVRLRYKLNISIKPDGSYTAVAVDGWFEEKPSDDWPQLSWKKARQSEKLYVKEQDGFFKILGCLEAQKKAAPKTSPTTT